MNRNEEASLNKKRNKLRRLRRGRRQRQTVCTILVLLMLVLSGSLFLEAREFDQESVSSGPLIISRDRAQGEEVPEAQETAKPAKSQTDFTANNWKLTLVNPWNPLPEDYDVTLASLKDGHAVDERCYPDLQRMMDDCRAEGLNPLICSSYRTQEKQERLFQNQVNGFVSRGYSLEDAKTEAGKIVAAPGTSEHQLGLAVDIVDVANQNLDESQEKTAVQQWLMENSWRYGFILRYPNDKSSVTGIIYEPWHYRYVGGEAAKEIFQQRVCLEEYLEQIQTKR